MKHPESRNTLYLEHAELLEHIAFEGNQYYMRLRAPLTASRSQPGSFIHMQCDTELPMRRPMSIMRTDKKAGWIDLLYKVHGIGTARLSTRNVGESIDLGRRVEYCFLSFRPGYFQSQIPAVITCRVFCGAEFNMFSGF